MPLAPRTRAGLLAGGLAAALEGFLLVGAVPQLDVWLLVQAILFWFGAGLMVVTSDWGWPPRLHALSATLLLFAPWFVNEVLLARAWGHAVPLVMQALVFAALFDLLRRRADRGTGARDRGVR